MSLNFNSALTRKRKATYSKLSDAVAATNLKKKDPEKKAKISIDDDCKTQEKFDVGRVLTDLWYGIGDTRVCTDDIQTIIVQGRSVQIHDDDRSNLLGDAQLGHIEVHIDDGTGRFVPVSIDASGGYIGCTLKDSDLEKLWAGRGTLPENYDDEDGSWVVMHNRRDVSVTRAQMSLPEDLYLTPNFITSEEEKDILKFLYSKKWNTEISRRTQHYGYRYVYSTKSLETAPDIPPIIKKIGYRIQKQYDLKKSFDQVIVNEYMPGQGIAAHTDHKNHFGPVIASLSLKSAVNMKFKGKGKKYTIRLEPRMLMLMKGFARRVLRHGIKAKLYDVVNDKKIPRDARVSITYRTIVMNNR